MVKHKSIGTMVKNSPILGACMITAILLTVMLILKPNYLSFTNVEAILKVLTVTALVGFSQMVVISTGGMNVAVGSIGALCAVLAGFAMQIMGLPAIPAIFISLLTGAVCGAINGLLIYRAGGVGTAFFLTTLATSFVFKGITLMITSGNPYYDIDPMFYALGDTKLLGLALSFWMMLLVAVVLTVFYKKLALGRQLLAYGANPKAAMLYGISKFKVVMSSNILSGLLAALTGMVAMIRIQAAQPNMGGEWMLQSFAATLIGGTLLDGGRVNVLGTIIGALALTIITNGLVHLSVDTFWNTLIYGCVVLLAVSIDRIRFMRK